MPYLEITYKAGSVIEIKKTFSTRRGKKGIKRAPNTAPTVEQVKKNNDKLAEASLRHKLYCNFKPGDWHLTATYKDKGKGPTPEEARKNMKNFLSRARGIFRQQGKEMKYIYSTEYKTSNKIHHHIIFEGVDIRPLQKLWAEYGGTLRTTMINDIEHLTNLASYLIKETQNSYHDDGRHVRRYCASQNLVEPTVTTREVAANAWQKEPKAKDGYYFDKTVGNGKGYEEFEHFITGMPCQFVRMVRCDIHLPTRRILKKKGEHNI